jgi:hypothetical protein
MESNFLKSLREAARAAEKNGYKPPPNIQEWLETQSAETQENFRIRTTELATEIYKEDPEKNADSDSNHLKAENLLVTATKGKM